MSEDVETEVVTWGIAHWEGEAALRALRSIQAASVCRKNDKMRPVLGGVLLTRGRAIATDSYSMAIVSLDYTGKDVLLPSEVVNNLAKVKVPKYPAGASLAIEESLFEVTVQVSFHDGRRIFSGRMEGTFPTWESLIEPPQGIVTLQRVSYSSTSLARMAQMVKVLGGDETMAAVLLHLPSEQKPSMFRITVRDVAVVDYWLMPVRVVG